MEFEVKNVDVITRRNKIQDSCLENWRSYDKQFMENKMKTIGCKPPHWESSLNVPICSNKTQMKLFLRKPPTHEIVLFGPPCKVIERHDYFYYEREVDYSMYVLKVLQFITIKHSKNH